MKTKNLICSLLFALSTAAAPRAALAVGLPTMYSGPTANPIAPTSATLNGAVNSDGLVTAAWFKFGLTTNYGTATPTRLFAGVFNPPSLHVLSFNGVYQNATVSGFGNYAPMSEITIEFWQLAYDAQTQSTFILNPDMPADRINAHLPWVDGNSYWDFGNAGGAGRLQYPTNISTAWTHVALVASQSANTMSLYINGSLVSTTSGMTPFTQYAADLLIGGGTVNNLFFYGQLSEFRVWSKALDQATIQTWMNRTLNSTHPDYLNLVAYWPMNEGSGSTLNDLSGNNRSASLSGAPTWVTLVNTPITAQITGLSPGATYHYQLVASNSAGVVTSPDLSFTTPLFTNANPNILQVDFGAATVADFDNDGKLDVLLNGYTNNNVQAFVSEIWRNEGALNFNNLNIPLAGVAVPSLGVADLFNDGNMDVVLAGTTTGQLQNPIFQVWRNLGGGVFTNLNVGIPGFTFGALALADFDNDGKVDILLSGYNSANLAITELWRNLGNGVFTNIPTALPPLADSAIAIGDFDNDGRPDVLLTGYDPNSGLFVIDIWRNLGNFNFTNVHAGLSTPNYPVLAVADFDNDGKLDVLIAGPPGALTNASTQLYRNLGNFSFTNINSGLPGLSSSYGGGAIVTGDFDNDGFTDVLLSGSSTNYSQISQVWRNGGNGSFNQFGGSLDLVAGSSLSAAAADFEGAGKLEILISGADNNFNPATRIYRSIITTTNTPPTAPTGLAASPGVSNVVFRWNAASDAQTPAAALSYNLRVGTTPGGIDVLSPEANTATGLRRVAQPGNAGENLFATLNLPPGTYYWSVQAVDTAFAGSPFAPESQVTVGSNGVVSAPRFMAITSQSGNNALLKVTGTAGTSYTLQSSTNLTQWTTLASIVPGTNGLAQFTVTNATKLPKQFFRLKYP